MACKYFHSFHMIYTSVLGTFLLDPVKAYLEYNCSISRVFPNADMANVTSNCAVKGVE